MSSLSFDSKSINFSEVSLPKDRKRELVPNPLQKDGKESGAVFVHETSGGAQVRACLYETGDSLLITQRQILNSVTQEPPASVHISFGAESVEAYFSKPYIIKIDAGEPLYEHHWKAFIRLECEGIKLSITDRR